MAVPYGPGYDPNDPNTWEDAYRKAAAFRGYDQQLPPLAGGASMEPPKAMQGTIGPKKRPALLSEPVQAILDNALRNLSATMHAGGNVLERMGKASAAYGGMIPQLKPVAAAGGWLVDETGKMLNRGAEPIDDYRNGLQPIRMDHGLMSLHVDPKLMDTAFSAQLASAPLKALGRAGGALIEDGAITGSRDAATRFGAAGQRGYWVNPGTPGWNQAKANAYLAKEAAGEVGPGTWAETGTMRLKDGSLVQEVSEHGATLKTDHAWHKPLDEVLDAPRVKAADPEAWNKTKVTLTIDPEMKGAAHGFYDHANNHLSVTAPNDVQALDKISHEMTHLSGRSAPSPRATGADPNRVGKQIDAMLDDPDVAPELKAKLRRYKYDDYGAYRAHQDEVLARAAEKRRHLTPENAAEMDPAAHFDTDPEHWIVSRSSEPGLSMAKGRPAPKKTVKAYKLFRVDPKQPGKLFPLFVDANKEVPIGEWVSATSGPRSASGKGVKSKIGELAYRPGWHAGEYPTANHIGGDRVGSKPTTRRPDQVWAEVEMPADKDWQAVANERGRNAKGEVVPVKAHITDEMPHGGHYRYKTNSNMEGDWLISGDMKVNRVLSDDEVAAINSKAGRSDLPRKEPFNWQHHGWQPGKARVNIGLMRGKSGEYYTADEAVQALKDLGLEPTEHGVVASGTEPTLVAQLPRAATAAELDKLSGILGQEAIAQKVGDAGELYGPKAAEWGPFNNDFFHDLDRLRNMTPADVKAATMHEPDMAPSFLQNRKGDPSMKGAPIDYNELAPALELRAKYRAEPNTTPGPKGTDAEWQAYGEAHGVNMTVTPPQEVAPGVQIPGGLEGKFTIPDLFWMKANNFNPKDLPPGMHEALMNKIMRTYAREEMTNPPVDMFNRLVFGQMSPNAPLLQNEALASRLRVTNIDELKRIAYGHGSDVTELFGLQAAGKGGMGLRGTPDPNAVRELARILVEHPEAFEKRAGETTRDVALRMMNSIPLMSQKTASLSAPLLDIIRGSTSAVDLHVIRNNWRAIMRDPKFGPDFVKQLAEKFKVEPNYKAIEAAYDAKPGRGLEVVRSIVERKSGGKMRVKGGKVNPRAPQAIQDGTIPEPANFQDFGPLYDRFSQELSKEHIGDLPVFANQWAKWDTYRGRFEPHEFQHPDYAKLPKQSWSELKRSVEQQRKAGFAKKSGLPDKKYEGTWKDLYYGKADPDLLKWIAGGGAAAALAAPAVKKGKKR